MNECQSECDCDGPDELLGIDHAPDCHSRRVCEDGLYCDKHFEEAAQDNARVLRSPIGQTQAEIDQELIDAGRGASGD